MTLMTFYSARRGVDKELRENKGKEGFDMNCQDFQRVG